MELVACKQLMQPRCQKWCFVIRWWCIIIIWVAALPNCSSTLRLRGAVSRNAHIFLRLSVPSFVVEMEHGKPNFPTNKHLSFFFLCWVFSLPEYLLETTPALIYRPSNFNSLDSTSCLLLPLIWRNFNCNEAPRLTAMRLVWMYYPLGCHSL